MILNGPKRRWTSRLRKTFAVAVRLSQRARSWYERVTGELIETETAAPPTPHRTHEIVLGYDAITVADQVDQQVEDLRLESNRFAGFRGDEAAAAERVVVSVPAIAYASAISGP